MNSITTKLKRRLPKGNFIKSVGVLVGGNAVGQGVVILASPLIARLYTPNEFGTLAVYASILAVLAAIAGLRYELAIPLPKDEQQAAQILTLSFLALFATTGLSALLIGLLANQIVNWTNTPELKPYIWLLPAGMLAIGSYQNLNYWGIRKKAFKQIARTKVNQGVSGVVAQLGFGLAQLGPLGLILGQIVGQSAGILTLGRQLERQDLKQVTRAGIMTALRRYKNFPLFSAPTGLMNALGRTVPSLLLASLYSIEIAGYFLLANRMINVPVQLVGGSVATAYYSKATEARSEQARLTSLFWKVARYLAVFGVLVAVPLALFGRQLFGFVFGQDWATAGTYAAALTALLATRLVVNPLSSTLSVIERQQLTPLVHGIILLASAGSILAAHSLGMSPTAAVLTYSIVTGFAYLTVLFILRSALISGRTAS